MRDELRILWTTPAYTPHAIAVHPRVDAGIRHALQQALVAIDTDASRSDILARLKLKGFVAARNSDWDDVRALKIDTQLGKGE